MSGVELPAGVTALGPWVLDRTPWPSRPDAWLAHKTDRPDLQGIVVSWPDVSEGRASARRMVASLRTLAQEAIPLLLDTGTSEGRVWVVTLPAEGELLSDILESGPVDWRDACTLVWSVGRALAVANGHGISHRDVSPTNIVVAADWTAQLMGWDLAMDDAALAQAANPPLGDIKYVAPEVIAQPLQHGPRADLYALGIVFYEMMTGRSAFPAAAMGNRPEQAATMLEWKTRAAPLDASAHAPPWLASLLRRATDAAPEKRLPDVDALVGWLDAAQGAWVRMGGGRSGVPARPRSATPPPAIAAQESRLSAASIRLAPAMDLQMQTSAIAIPANLGPPVEFYYLWASVIGLMSGAIFAVLVIAFAEIGA